MSLEAALLRKNAGVLEPGEWVRFRAVSCRHILQLLHNYATLTHLRPQDLWLEGLETWRIPDAIVFRLTACPPKTWSLLYAVRVRN